MEKLGIDAKKCSQVQHECRPWNIFLDFFLNLENFILLSNDRCDLND